MNKIFNWVFGSFFRTLGRIFVYILVGFLISYLLKDFDFSKINIFHILNVQAESINIRQTADGYLLINDNSNEYQTFIINPNSNATLRIKIATALSESDIYSYMFMDVCSTRDIDAVRTSSPGQSCTNSCWSNQVYTEKTNYLCTTNSQNGQIYRITTPIQKWEKDLNDEMAYVNDQITIRNSTSDIISTTIYGVYVSNDTNNGSINIDYTDVINNIGNRQITAIDATTSAVNNVAEEARENTQDIIDNQNSNNQALQENINNQFNISCDNLYDNSNVTIYNAYLTDTTGGTPNVWLSSNDSRSIRVPVSPNKTYTVSTNYSDLTVFRVAWINTDNLPTSGNIPVYGQIRKTNNSPITITTGSDAKYLVIQLSATTINSSLSTLMINEGSSAKPYCAYGSSINRIDETNDKLDYIGDKLTDDSPPTNIDSLNNSAGWLPAGPVDAILNLPLSFLTNLNTNLSKSCEPVNLPLPFINQNLPLPCVNSLYSQIDGLPNWINTIGIIASAFILFGYFINLYKYIDDTLTFRENNYIDNWSGV